LLIAGAGCESDDHYREHYRGGAYDRSYRESGRDTWDRDHDGDRYRDYDQRRWEHRDNRY
jgi:hypothetical protein